MTFRDRALQSYARNRLNTVLLLFAFVTQHWAYLSLPSTVYTPPPFSSGICQYDNDNNQKEPLSPSTEYLTTTALPIEKGTLNHPIIFIHGINQNACYMGIPRHDSSKNQFELLYEELLQMYQAIYTFTYVDDQAYGKTPNNHSSNPCPQCISQSSVSLNAEKLSGVIMQIYSATHRKVALIGYSMGGAIIRTLLAGCLQNAGDQEDPLCQEASTMVDDVFFINGVQQGSWLMPLKNAITATSPFFAVLGTAGVPVGLDYFIFRQMAIDELSSMGLRANSDAAHDLTPKSSNINAQNSVEPPDGIRYFNFYGDIHLQFGQTFFDAPPIALKNVDVGDLVLLPGLDAPTATPAFGGAQFCRDCGGNNTSQIGANTTYKQWPLSSNTYFNYSDLLSCQLLTLATCTITTYNIKTSLMSSPQQHLKIYSNDSLLGVLVPDLTGTSNIQEVSIPQEIAYELESMPPTQTDCPTTGTARPAIMEPYATSNNPRVVYIKNEGQGNTTRGTLWTYSITSHKKTLLTQLANTNISEAKVSADGQWVLFVSNVYNQFETTPLYSKIQMIRTDGQGLQTLYCSPTLNTSNSQASETPLPINDISWSPDQQSVVFNETSPSLNPDVLNVAKGALETELAATVNRFYASMDWIDNSRIYVEYWTGSDQGSDNPASVTCNLYILDTRLGANQQLSNLQQFPLSSSYSNCPAITLSNDRTTLFIIDKAGTLSSDISGPSEIYMEPITGGKQTSIYSSQTQNVAGVVGANNTTLLFTIENHGNVDTSQNGLWKIYTDGTGLTRLTTDAPNEDSSIPSVLPGSYSYALQVINQNNTGTFVVGSLFGGTPTPFDSTDDPWQSQIVGWTTV